MKGIKHYLKNGKEYTGPMHKTAGKAMTGAKHTASSKPLFHKSSLVKKKQEAIMPYGTGTYGSKVGRPKKKAKPKAKPVKKKQENCNG